MPGPDTIGSVLSAAAAERPGGQAVVDGDLRWTFEELDHEVGRVAAALIAAGVGPGDRVAVWAPNSAKFVAAALGTSACGAVLVPINTRYKGAEARWVLEKSRAGVVLVAEGFLGNSYVDMIAGSGPTLPGLQIVDLGADWETFLQAGGRVDADEVTRRRDSVGPADLADMFFTSGTTGRPKGVLATHGQDVEVYRAWGTTVGLTSDDRYLIVNPLFHNFGYKAGALACVLFGATMVLQPVFDVPETMAIVEREQITVLPGPPTLYASILDHPSRGSTDLSSLRLAVTGAASVPVRLVERMSDELFPEVVVAYGLTETCGTATVGDPHDDPVTISTTVGRPIPGTEVIVADAHGDAVPAGEPGEVLVRGYNVMAGYFEDDDATRAAIDDRGFLHTGDVGVIDERGLLRITDRLKDMFVVGGFNAYPAEIEQAIMRMDSVREVSVIGVPDERLGEVGMAFVIARPGGDVTPEEVVAFCRETVANFKVPRYVRVVDELPRNPTGKVLKSVLRDMSVREGVSNA